MLSEKVIFLTLLKYSASYEIISAFLKAISQGGLKFYQHGQVLKPKQMLNKISGNQVAYDYMKKAKTNYDVSQVIGEIGGFMVGLPIGIANGGFTLLPQLAIDDLLTTKKKQVRPFKGIRPLREVGLVYVRSFAKQRLISILGEAIKNAVPKEMLEKESGTIVEWR